MRSIAIVDDSDSERAVLRGLVEEAGYEVVAEGSDGAQALEICKNLRPDLFIMDVRMPVMDGIEAAGEISRICPTPVVLLTASHEPETVRRATEAGVMGYISKPVRFEDLAPAIELAISRFSEFMMLQRENADLKSAVEARKLIEKAKGLLMAKEKMTEQEAFKRIRKISMDKRKTMKEIAEVLILALED